MAGHDVFAEQHVRNEAIGPVYIYPPLYIFHFHRNFILLYKILYYSIKKEEPLRTPLVLNMFLD